MADLYMKELILRRAGDRLLAVTPANLRPQWIRELSSDEVELRPIVIARRRLHLCGLI
jgi:hypothetical protein